MGHRRDLGLEVVRAPDLDEVRVAIAQERRASRAPTPVRVVAVTKVDGDDGRLFEIAVEADAPLPDARQWAGADIRRDLADGDEGVWRGSVLDVDPVGGRLFVEGDTPVPGMASVWPFDYLAALDMLLTSPRCAGLRRDLLRNLAAAAGDAVPARRPAPGLHPAWAHGWALVWGPPGTGKTWTLARQVARLLADPGERVLVVSTTNKATDGAALEVGRALRDLGGSRDGVYRVGHVVDPKRFREAGFSRMLPDPALAERIAAARAAAERAWGVDRAVARRAVRDLSRAVPGLRIVAADDRIRCAITTLYAATGLLVDEAVLRLLEAGEAPFTTVVVDEAGLVGRAHAAAVALLASRRVILVGDPRQLSPVARAARTLPREVVRWIAVSGLEHLRPGSLPAWVQHLDVQHRMDPAIGAAIADLQYDGALQTSASVRDRPWALSRALGHLPRVLWYVVDDHPGVGRDGAASRPGPGARSRIRPATRTILRALVAAEPSLASARGLFVTPYVAQAAEAVGWLREAGLDGWRASTVHAQQGAEADVVIFDTVHASSTGWPPQEWSRLVNVGLSRARELVLLIAGRAEVRQPWMRPLVPHLVPRVLKRQGPGWVWRDTEGIARFQVSMSGRQAPASAAALAREAAEPLGLQIARRKAQRPVLSQEQHRLVCRVLADAGPRLVRGVAGSGKTLVLAHWAVRTLRGLGFERVVILFANAALKPLLQQMLADAWEEALPAPAPAFPWDRVRLVHVMKLLEDLRRDAGLPEPEDRFDDEKQAKDIRASGPPASRFEALFIDEAQDFGHSVLELAVGLVAPRQGRRPVLVFYDDAQNLYRRRPPRWSALGLDMRGRSDVMRESFRSSAVIVETALTVVDRLGPGLEADRGFRELMREGLLVRRERGGAPWWEARFCVDDGQVPELFLAGDAEAEIAWVVERVRRLLEDDEVCPGDVRIVVLSGTLRRRLLGALGRALPVPVREVRQDGFVGLEDTVVLTTPHSFKGYDAEVVLVPGIDRYAPEGDLQLQALYVSLTRARSLLLMSASRGGATTPARDALLSAVEILSRQLLAG